MLWGGFRMTADIDAVDRATEGVVCALGDWFGGYALYVTGGIAHFTFARAADALQLDGTTPLEAGRHQVVVSYETGDGDGPGRMALQVDGVTVDEVAVEGMLPFAVQHGGAGLRLGFDSGFPVSPRYSPPAPFTGGVHSLTIETPGAAAPSPSEEVRAALHGD
jgi:arylsulfatase